MNTFRLMMVTLFHPSDGFYEVKEHNHVLSGLWLMVALLVIRFANIFATAYHFRSVDPEQGNLLFEVARILLPWLTFVLAQYAITTISEGEGFIAQVFAGTFLALTPYIVFSLPLAASTNLLSLAEAGVVRWAQMIIYGWSAVLLISMTQTIHNYDFGRALTILGLTVLSMLMVWAVIMLIYALSDQVVRFVNEVIVELSVR
ncbi:MAG: YIP1 family protein [Limnochordaceae bacterium]|nr:YIP1 family protein [Limnochordaceae bacterium]